MFKGPLPVCSNAGVHRVVTFAFAVINWPAAMVCSVPGSKVLGISTLGNGGSLKLLYFNVTAHQQIISIASLVNLESFFCDRVTFYWLEEFSFCRGKTNSYVFVFWLKLEVKEVTLFYGRYILNLPFYLVLFIWKERNASLIRTECKANRVFVEMLNYFCTIVELST